MAKKRRRVNGLEIEAIKKDRAAGMSVTKIAEKYKRSANHIYMILRRNKQNLPSGSLAETFQKKQEAVDDRTVKSVSMYLLRASVQLLLNTAERASQDRIISVLSRMTAAIDSLIA